MANIYKPQPTDGGDSGVWGPKELAQNQPLYGLNTCKLYDDSGTLKITVGQIGLIDSGKGFLDMDTVTTISLAGVTSNPCWFYVEAYRVGTTPTFAVTELPAETDPASFPAIAATAYAREKGGFYNISTRRIIGFGWVNTGGTLEGVVNCRSFNYAYVGYSTSDDVSDHVYRWDYMQDETFYSGYLGRLYMIPEDERYNDWILSAGNSSTFVDIDCSPYVPKGVSGLLLNIKVYQAGDNVNDAVTVAFRKNGSTETDPERLWHTQVGYTNLAAGTTIRMTRTVLVECDENGIVEYAVTFNDANAAVYANAMGFTMKDNL